ncbi:MAG: PilZ domain-containing protein [Calditrichaeota bacterium]|nr:PilZ domain-containing protein [Calditrichota bacterium]RQW07796.1 MAG: PilZ domain-containing protein [Calditrichota bacterium]
MLKRLLKEHLEKRQYIRHPAEISIEYTVGETDEARMDVTKNISFGGLCFQTHMNIEHGTFLTLKFPSINPKYKVRGKVVWCVRKKGYTEVGVQFMDENDAFRARMIEEVCALKANQIQNFSPSPGNPQKSLKCDSKKLFKGYFRL